MYLNHNYYITKVVKLHIMVSPLGQDPSARILIAFPIQLVNPKNNIEQTWQ